MRQGARATITTLLVLGSVHVPLAAQGPAALQTPDEDGQTSVWREAGYVLAMEAVFTGMSFLGSREGRLGPGVTGGFDLFMAAAGIQNASQESGAPKTGHYLISVGFAAKSLYNFHWGRDHGSGTRFWTNFIGYNVLVFAGYLLDTL